MADLGRALVACPTYAGKEYALDRWKAGFDALTYTEKHAYQVDNTRVSPAYFEELKKRGIDCSHLTPWPDWDRTFLACWRAMLKRAQQLDCYWVYSVEADNVPAPESLEVMVNIAIYGKLHLVTHAYPMHETARQASGIPENSFYYNELGCMLMTRSLLERALDEYEEYGNIALAIWRTCDRYHGGYCKLTNAFKVEHLDGYHQAFHNLDQTEKPGLMMPTPRMPENYGQELPKCLQAQ